MLLAMAFFLLCIFIIISQLTNFSIAQNSGRVNLSQSLTAGEKISSWLSPSGDFAFGFQQFFDNQDLFLLGIWFDKVPDKTVVWYADKNNPVPRGSKLTLTADGGLLLNDPQGGQLWNTNPIVSQVDFAVMNDTGNFVLQNKNSESIWESFKHPTDTLLPTQTMEMGDVISSRQSSTNFSRGRFQLHLLPDGNLVLNSVNLPSEFPNENYYESGTSNISNPGKQLVFNESGNIFISRENGQISTLTEGKLVSTKDYYYRATLNFDGVFSEYYRLKTTSSSRDESWTTLWSVPENICIASRVFKSSGACGFNRICRLNADRRPVCECPRGFTLLDSNDEYRGCKPDFIQDCQLDTESSPEELYVFQEITDVDWPTSDYEALQPYDEDKCKDSCLHDCMCAVAIMRNNTCWKKKLPLSNGRVDTNVGAKAYIKIRKANAVPDRDSGPSSSQTKSRNALIIGGSVLLGFSVFINFLLFGAMGLGFFFIYRKKSISIPQDKDVSRFNLRCFSYKDLVDATGGFEEELGRGSFGIVYRGVLKDTGEPVAVKKLDRTFRDSEKEFKAEVNVIGHIHHKNLVRLVGYCDEGLQRLLVYEFMSNGTLAGFLFDEMKPSWNQRTQIAFGVARGLLYLHEECSTQIIHCDIKPQNILDDFYNARISDFGLAKLLMMEQSQTLTAIRGTKGYVAPEWFRNMPITVKVDVYSFGELLLEIICCRRSVDLEMGGEEKAILAYWAYDCYRDGALDALVGNDKEAMNDIKNLERFLMVAFWCIQEDPSLRPTMKKVMLMLEGVVQVSVPPSPFLFGSIC